MTFVKVVRPLLLRLAGAASVPLMPLPVRAAFKYRKRTGRREYVRVKLVPAADGGIGRTNDPAGAFIDPTTLSRARALGLDPAVFLAENDSTEFFSRLGDRPIAERSAFGAAGDNSYVFHKSKSLIFMPHARLRA